ncbi:2OG-Fe(II) oxygenase [Pedobacter sp. MC2016-14]|uniref:2OG-Fe(II) oxygenase n=1 Tax=Pedobacter sp. MC2016-14 TaxID=2897327 RepID=UPI001E538E22|nr:2OG-Fe(II) oxygenase [Pedobacter sp. MC2016-14]MCD0487884.1 2OG-Fe(II) oxygenase [Pedobacter sp. MC2016-14]
MEKIFDTLIESFITNKIGIADDFLSAALSGHLKDNLIQLYQEQRLQKAGLGNDSLIVQDQLFRGDVIYWLDREHNNSFENEFFDLMDSFVSYLNRSCYTGITGYEFHYTMYEEGSFYKRHLDQFRNNDSRQFSMIMYLNADWQVIDGGELCIHQDGKAECIAPQSGKSVFFKSSELEHEVLMTHKARMSITGWLKI